MKNYSPDNWVIIKFKSDDPHYRILSGWSGGYTTGSSWRINSAILSCQEFSDYVDYFVFNGLSGSEYRCGKESYGLRMNNAHVWNKLEEMYGDKVELMDEDTDWINIDWIIK